MAKKNKSKKKQLKPRINSDNDEIGVIGISLALTALSASIIFGNETDLYIMIISVFIYILGGLATSFLYYTFLANKIPETMDKWQSKGGMNLRGTFWIFRYYSKLFFKQMFTVKGNTLVSIRELGYLTILAMLFILWITFAIPIAIAIVKLFTYVPNT